MDQMNNYVRLNNWETILEMKLTYRFLNPKTNIIVEACCSCDKNKDTLNTGQRQQQSPSDSGPCFCMVFDS